MTFGKAKSRGYRKRERIIFTDSKYRVSFYNEKSVRTLINAPERLSTKPISPIPASRRIASALAAPIGSQRHLIELENPAGSWRSILF
jgi:hypothetical protein